MRWNYRICKKGNSYAIHEVHFNEQGIWAVTENPIAIVEDICEWSCEDEKECIDSMRSQMEKMGIAFTKPVLDLDTIVFVSNPFEDDAEWEEDKNCSKE